MKIKKIIGMIVLVSLLCTGCNSGAQKISLKEQAFSSLVIFADALVNIQISDSGQADFGALKCAHCNVLHTRAGEAVYPLAVCFKHTQDVKYLDTALRLGNWLITQQMEDGAWKETPEEWTGTSTDQLLMLSLAYPILADHMESENRAAWRSAIKKAADYLAEVMSPEFASINYCATTTASLVYAHTIIPDQKYLDKAGTLARQIVSRMDSDGFISGEGGRIRGIKYGADIGYELDMSLWGLALYARMTGDEQVEQMVSRSLHNHLYFVYPDGMIDATWGIRSNKWTVYGSGTADGCQILFSLFAGRDARYRTAALRNLELLNTMHQDGIIGYGPQYFEIFDTPPCIYPTFVRSKNLAMTVELGEQEPGILSSLPTEKPRWMKIHKTVDVVQVRTDDIMATVTAYRYKDTRGGAGSKYMHRPTGGAMSNLWIRDYGLLQTASQTEYQRWEPMHFPPADGILPLTSRIEFVNDEGYFTNLYEFDASLYADSLSPDLFRIEASGFLKDKHQNPGGVAYTLTHEIHDSKIIRTIDLKYHDRFPEVHMVEPFIEYSDMQVKLISPDRIELTRPGKSITLSLIEGDAVLSGGKNRERFWSPYPALKCYPVELVVTPRKDPEGQKIVYEIVVKY